MRILNAVAVTVPDSAPPQLTDWEREALAAAVERSREGIDGGLVRSAGDTALPGLQRAFDALTLVPGGRRVCACLPS